MWLDGLKKWIWLFSTSGLLALSFYFSGTILRLPYLLRLTITSNPGIHWHNDFSDNAYNTSYWLFQLSTLSFYTSHLLKQKSSLFTIHSVLTLLVLFCKYLSYQLSSRYFSFFSFFIFFLESFTFTCPSHNLLYCHYMRRLLNNITSFHTKLESFPTSLYRLPTNNSYSCHNPYRLNNFSLKFYHIHFSL